MSTTVAQRKRTKGWRKPEGSVCVDRTSRWGNPYKVGRDGEWWTVDQPVGGTTHWHTKERALRQAAMSFRLWVRYSDDETAAYIRHHVHELRGQTLLCWCPQPGPCHAHVLAEMADREADQ